MALTKKGKKIMKAMKDEYGKTKGEGIFYASRNKGTIKGVEKGRGGYKMRDGKGGYDAKNRSCRKKMGRGGDASHSSGVRRLKMSKKK